MGVPCERCVFKIHRTYRQTTRIEAKNREPHNSLKQHLLGLHLYDSKQNIRKKYFLETSINRLFVQKFKSL